MGTAGAQPDLKQEALAFCVLLWDLPPLSFIPINGRQLRPFWVASVCWSLSVLGGEKAWCISSPRGCYASVEQDVRYLSHHCYR